MLSVDGDRDGLPPAVLKLAALGEPERVLVFGTYKVCPLEERHQDAIRRVCIESAKKLSAVRWDGSVIKSKP